MLLFSHGKPESLTVRNDFGPARAGDFLLRFGNRACCPGKTQEQVLAVVDCSANR